ncbi:HNH endonuclease, partial [Ralstonia pseudosolanacearum]
FSWGQVAMGAVGAGVTAGVGTAAAGSGTWLGAQGTNAAGIAAGVGRAAIGSVATQGIAVAVGLQDHFSWMQVATAAASSAAGSLAGAAARDGLNYNPSQGFDFGKSLVSGAAAGIAAGTTAAVMRGGRVQIAQIAADAFGNALGSSLAEANLPQPTMPQSAWDGTSYKYLDKTPVEGIFLGTAGGANTAAYASPDPILLASAGGIMSDAASPQEEAMMRMQGRQMEPWGTNPVYQNGSGENIAVNPLPATTARAIQIPALLDPETYTPGAYDYTDGSRELLSGQFAGLGNGLGGLGDRQVQEFAGTVQGLAQTVVGAVRFVNDQGWVAANALTGGWLAHNNADAAAAIQRNTSLGQAISAAPGAIASFGLRAAMGNVSLDEIGQGISTAWQSDRIDQLKAAGDYAGAQAIRTQNVLGIASLAVGGEGLVAGAAEASSSLARTAAMGTRLAAEEFADSRTAQLAGAMIERRLYQVGAGPAYMMPPDFTVAPPESVEELALHARAAVKGYPGVRVTPNGGPTFAGTDYLFPVDVGQKNIVDVAMTGSRRLDFKAANQAAGIQDLVPPGADAPSGYVWHHVDNYNLNTGSATLELVEQGAHRATIPHAGSVSQWEFINGIPYKR